jgi:hypothetical protein
MFLNIYFFDCLVQLLEGSRVYYSLQSTARLDIKSVIIWSLYYVKQLRLMICCVEN